MQNMLYYFARRCAVGVQCFMQGKNGGRNMANNKRFCYERENG